METERKRHLAGDTTHQEYYSAIAKDCGVSFAKSSMLPEIITALAHGDEHLNEIELHRWDNLGWHLAGQKRVKEAFKQRGDFVTTAGLVCVLKAAAREAANV
jgi:hypothetical protein